jgi:hypothetical protein
LKKKNIHHEVHEGNLKDTRLFRGTDRQDGVPKNRRF